MNPLHRFELILYADDTERERERERERDDAPVTGFFEFQLITRCKHRLGGGGREREKFMLRAWLVPRGMHLSMLSSSMTVNPARFRCAITQRFRPTSPAATFWADGYVFMHEFRPVEPQIFEISPTPPRDFRVFTNRIKRNIQYPRVLHPRHLRPNVRDTRDGRLLCK